MISIECNKGLPLEYETFLIERYASFLATCRYVEVYYPTHDLHHMFVYKDGRLIDLLLLGNKGNTVQCFNALAELDVGVIKKCIEKIFEIFPHISKIKIDASYASYDLEKSILFYKSDDHILDLPSNIESYSAGLGSKTRKHLKARIAKLDNEFSSVNFITRFGSDIEESIVDKIIQLNGDRMKCKGKIHGIDNSYKDNIYKYSQYYGCVIYLELDGKIVAGCIASILDKSLFLNVIAHDNEYSKYNVGEVCVFNLIQTAIDKELTTLHFLWGVSELKRRFLAKSHELYSYYVFRNYSPAYLNELVKKKSFDMVLRLKNTKMFDFIRNSVQDYRKKSLKSY